MHLKFRLIMVDAAAQLLHLGFFMLGRLFDVVLELCCIAIITIPLLLPCHAEIAMRRR